MADLLGALAALIVILEGGVGVLESVNVGMGGRSGEEGAM